MSTKKRVTAKVIRPAKSEMSTKVRRMLSIFIIGMIGMFLVTGCVHQVQAGGANSSTSAEHNSQINIVATTTMLADLAQVIGGENVTVRGLMGPGVDPHLYQASAGDVQVLQNADVVVYNGLHLEGKLGEIFESLTNQGSAVICIGEGLEKSQLLHADDNPNLYDPHIWFDVKLWKEAAKVLAQGLMAIDEKHSAQYQENLEQYLKELDELDNYVRTRIAEVPEKQRVLITAHDAFRYFGAAYGFEVRGLQGISTDAEAGTSDVSELADFIAERHIKAIFIESSVPPKTIEALQAAVKARGFAVAIGGELYSDSLGGEGSGAESYILTFKANIDTIVNALK